LVGVEEERRELKVKMERAAAAVAGPGGQFEVA